MDKFLFKQIDNIGLVLFRTVFGLLITIEAFGAIATGWVRRTLVEPPFTFNFIGFDFLQVFQGEFMYFYFVVMGIFGILVTIGYKYRFSMFAYALLWSGVYLMQKSSYNNHYYLMMLLCWIMAFLPANRWLSIDAKINPEIRTSAMPQWVLWVLILQVWIVYTYASIAKWYPGWLDASVPALFMSGRADYWLIGGLLQETWVHWTIAYTGVLFDLLIIPMMLWRRTRLLGFVLSLLFHLFNSVVFQIGIFPYMSIAFALFFFSPEILRKRFFVKRELYERNGYFSLEKKVAMDYDFLVRIRNEKFAFLDVPITVFMPGGTSEIQQEQGAKEIRESYEEHVGKDLRIGFYMWKRKMLLTFLGTSAGKWLFKMKHKKNFTKLEGPS